MRRVFSLAAANDMHMSSMSLVRLSMSDGFRNGFILPPTIEELELTSFSSSPYTDRALVASPLSRLRSLTLYACVGLQLHSLAMFDQI